LEDITFGLVQLISDFLGKIGVGEIVCLYIIHAKLVNLINRIKMKRSRIWNGNSKNNKRFNFEDQFDELFARS